MLLTVSNIDTGYEQKRVICDVSISVEIGEIVALIGPNGAGKSTVLKAICGLIPAWKGQIGFDGKPTTGLAPAERVRRGITFAPQGNRVFADLTVAENLEIGGFPLQRNEVRQRVAEVLDLFPSLKTRLRQKAGTLSGGEQQMLALARALVPKPKLLILDEPSLGLAPNLLADVFNRIAEINLQTSVAILIVEQRVDMVLSICSRVYALKLGRVSFSGMPNDLVAHKTRIRDLFL